MTLLLAGLALAGGSKAIDEVVARFGRIDVLLNNAGVIAVGPLEDMTVADFESALDGNYRGMVHATLAVLPDMRRRGEGRIVNITSIGGKVAVPHLLPYCAAKFAAVGFSEGLRAEAARDGVVVTTVVPGLMRTGSPPNADFKGRHRREYAWFAIGDSLPITSMSAETAAARILDACRQGTAEITLGWSAWASHKFQALFPGLCADLAAVADRFLLPSPGGIGTASAKGRDSESALTRSVLTRPTREAAAANNEIPGAPASAG
jgi:short-subunit dehydrogenase